MAPGGNDGKVVKRGTIIPDDWIPVTAVRIAHDDSTHFQYKVFVPAHWIPPSSSRIVICCTMYEEDEFDELPDYIRYIFGTIDSHDKENDKDFNELYTTLVECGSFPEGYQVGYFDVADLLPQWEFIDALHNDLSSKHVMVIWTEEVKTQPGQKRVWVDTKEGKLED